MAAFHMGFCRLGSGCQEVGSENKAMLHLVMAMNCLLTLAELIRKVKKNIRNACLEPPIG